MDFNVIAVSIAILCSVAGALYALITSFRELRSRGTRGTFSDDRDLELRGSFIGHRRTHEKSGVYGGRRRHLDDVKGGVDSEATNEFAHKHGVMGGYSVKAKENGLAGGGKESVDAASESAVAGGTVFGDAKNLSDNSMDNGGEEISRDAGVLARDGVIGGQRLRDEVMFDRRETPLETKHLDNYYAQVLMQSKAAFWFSLMFASMGFMVIIAAAMMYSDGKTTATVIQGIAGIIIDSVAALFFVQSKRAQVSMSEYFEKLRKDRQKGESRKLCDEISDPRLKNELSTRLALYYAGIEDYEQEAKRIIEAASHPPLSGKF